MISSYTLTGQPVNPSAQITPVSFRLSSGAESFYRWIWRWHEQTGDVHPSTGYFARKQRVTERTVYNWLRALKQAGRIQTEVEEGIERRIIPVVPPPPTPSASKPRGTSKRPRRISPAPPVEVPEQAAIPGAPTVPTVAPTPALTHAVSGAISGVVFRGLTSKTQHTQDATTCTTQESEPSASVVALIQEGVFPPVAAQLLVEYGEEAVIEQVEALPHRSARDRAAMLVKSIRETWSIPAALRRQREKEQQEAQKAAKQAAEVILARKQAEERQKREKRLSELSDGERAALEQRAREEILREKGKIARDAEQRNGPIWRGMLQCKMLFLLAVNSG